MAHTDRKREREREREREKQTNEREATGVPVPFICILWKYTDVHPSGPRPLETRKPGNKAFGERRSKQRHTATAAERLTATERPNSTTPHLGGAFLDRSEQAVGLELDVVQVEERLQQAPERTFSYLKEKERRRAIHQQAFIGIVLKP